MAYFMAFFYHYSQDFITKYVIQKIYQDRCYILVVWKASELGYRLVSQDSCIWIIPFCVTITSTEHGGRVWRVHLVCTDTHVQRV
jgi:hypothetical protein